ncbi:MAG: YfcE family phosphodiesterase [Pseudomonadota bacterium]
MPSRQEKQGLVRLAVFADTHGHKTAVDEACRLAGPFDCLVHLGDGVEDGRAAAAAWGIPFRGVAGNEDFMSGEPERSTLEAAGWKILLIHGHQTDINPFQPRAIFDEHLATLSWMAEQEQAEMLLFGHTHRAMIEKRGGLILGNPGEMHPGSSQPPTFMLILALPNQATLRLMARKGKDAWAPEREETFTRRPDSTAGAGPGSFAPET